MVVCFKMMRILLYDKINISFYTCINKKCTFTNLIVTYLNIAQKCEFLKLEHLHFLYFCLQISTFIQFYFKSRWANPKQILVCYFDYKQTRWDSPVRTRPTNDVIESDKRWSICFHLCHLYYNPITNWEADSL